MKSVMRLSFFLNLMCIYGAVCQEQAIAQVVLYPNGKRVKILSSVAGANQLSGNQKRYIISEDREVYVDPKKQELDEEQARARLAYSNEDEAEETVNDSADHDR